MRWWSSLLPQGKISLTPTGDEPVNPDLEWQKSLEPAGDLAAPTTNGEYGGRSVCESRRFGPICPNGT
jgi:hypothetical protein